MPKKQKGRGRNGQRSKRPKKGGASKRGPKDSRRPKGRGRSFKKQESRGRSKQRAMPLVGTIDKNPKGFAFLVFDNRDFEDLFIGKREARPFFHGDRVQATVYPSGEVEDFKILAHRALTLTGRFFRDAFRPNAGWLQYFQKRSQNSIPIYKAPADLADGSYVRVKLEYDSKNRREPHGKIIKQFGEVLPSNADLDSISGEFGLEEHHSNAAKAEAKKLRFLLDPSDERRRKDLRKLDFMTIDGEDARDFDDAVYVEKDKKSYILWVAIADVSYYVRPGTTLDDEAIARATSVYFPERAFHMIPSELSENLCSLRPNEDRMALVAKIRFDQNGNRKSVEPFEAMIRSKRRATYTEIEKEKDDPKHQYLFELYRLLNKQRIKRGSIDFDFPEAKVQLDEEGEPTEVKITQRLDAHRLIEEFMIAANEAVTKWMMKLEFPFVYRIHERPDHERLEKFKSLGKSVGIKLELDSETISPKGVSKILKRIENHPAKLMLQLALLQSLKRAIYTPSHDIHFGLASEAYTHFTSPIRRYPDLVVHRLIKYAILTKKDKLSKKERKVLSELETDLDEITSHCSHRERLAEEAERASIKLKQTRLMRNHLGEEFDARVIGMNERGMFLQIDQPYVEGFLPKESLGSDHFLFNQEKMIFFGRRSRKKFQIGDKVEIQVARADLDTRTIDFDLVETNKTADR